MGVALFRRPRDGAVFAIVSAKSGGPTDYLWQYRLIGDAGGLKATLVRRFGSFSGVGPAPGEAGEIEAVVVDDELGYVYYSDERFGIHKWHADPDARGASTELAVFGKENYEGDREGLAIYQERNGTGYIVSSDQVDDSSRIHLYRREGAPGNPHLHQSVTIIKTLADATDGLEVTSRSLPGFRGGLLVMMNSRAHNFQLYRWEEIELGFKGSGH